MRVPRPSILVCPFTSTVIVAGPVRPLVQPDPRNGLKVPSQVMADKISAVAAIKTGPRIGSLSAEAMQAIDTALAKLLRFRDANLQLRRILRRPAARGLLEYGTDVLVAATELPNPTPSIIRALNGDSYFPPIINLNPEMERARALWDAAAPEFAPPLGFDGPFVSR